MVPRAVELALSEKLKLGATDPVTPIWSQATVPQDAPTLAVAQLSVSALPVVPPPEPVPAQSVELVQVVITPVLLFVALLLIVRAAVLVQLKQYQVLAVRLLLVNWTVWPLIWLALDGAVMPVQAVAVVVSSVGSSGQVAGELVVLTAQLPKVPLTV